MSARAKHREYTNNRKVILFLGQRTSDGDVIGPRRLYYPSPRPALGQSPLML